MRERDIFYIKVSKYEGDGNTVRKSNDMFVSNNADNKELQMK